MVGMQLSFKWSGLTGTGCSSEDRVECTGANYRILMRLTTRQDSISNSRLAVLVDDAGLGVLNVVITIDKNAIIVVIVHSWTEKFPVSLVLLLALCHSWRRAAVVGILLCLSCQLLFQSLLGNQIFVGLALIPIFSRFLSEANKAQHSQNIVPKSHKKGPNAKEFSTAGGLGLDSLDLQNQLALLKGVCWDGLNARSNPFPVHHTLAGSAFALSAPILDVLACLGGHVTNGLAGPGHAGSSGVALFEDNGNGSLETDTIVSQ